MQKLSTPYIHVVLGLDWAQQLINPLNVVRCSLRENYHDDLSALFVKYWAFPIVLTFAANAVVFHIYNIEITQHLEFLILYLVSLSLKLFFAAFIIHATLKVVGLESKLGVVFLCYSIIVIYSPIMSCLVIPNTFNLYSMLKQIKDLHLDLITLYHYFFDHVGELTKNNIQTPKAFVYAISILDVISNYSSRLCQACRERRCFEMPASPAVSVSLVSFRPWRRGLGWR
jgi:hypothetical protein